jgi:Predicted Zn-dependent hydrolases of the beta-lactamase fold
MKTKSIICILLFVIFCTKVDAQHLQADSYPAGNDKTLKVTLVGHGSVMFEYDNRVIHVDPYSNVADYTKLPKADLIILTHEHADHLDMKAIDAIKIPQTQFIVSAICNEKLGYGEIVGNGDKTAFETVSIEAVPAYNIVHRHPSGAYYHPKGDGNGYVFTFGELRVYVAGDTENISEMNLLKDIDIAFLPKNLPYTMTDEMFIDAAKTLQPTYLYPYHFSEFDEEKIGNALKNTTIQLLVRPMKNTEKF